MELHLSHFYQSKYCTSIWRKYPIKNNEIDNTTQTVHKIVKLSATTVVQKVLIKTLQNTDTNKLRWNSLESNLNELTQHFPNLNTSHH